MTGMQTVSALLPLIMLFIQWGIVRIYENRIKEAEKRIVELETRLKCGGNAITESPPAVSQPRKERMKRWKGGDNV